MIILFRIKNINISEYITEIDLIKNQTRIINKNEIDCK